MWTFCPWVFLLVVVFIFFEDATGQTTTAHPRSHHHHPHLIDGRSTLRPEENLRVLSDVVDGRHTADFGDAKPAGGNGVTAQCDVTNHSHGCKVDAYERCFRPGYCGCLKGFVRRDSGDCVAAQFFQGRVSVMDTFPDQRLTDDSPDYHTFVSEVSEMVLRALTSDERARGVLRVRVTSVSREEGRVLIGWEVAVGAASNWKAEELTRVYNSGIVGLAYVDASDSLIKLNGTDLVMGANGTLPTFLQPVRAFDLSNTTNIWDVSADQSLGHWTEFSHCVDKDHNYCDVSANCVHSLGSFTCTCRQGFDDVSPDVTNTPGERCVQSCGCQNNGACKQDPFGDTHCECTTWYLGSKCEINGKEILIITTSVVAALLVLTVFLCLVRRGLSRRTRNSGRKSSGGCGSSMAGGVGSVGSLDTSLVKLPRVWMDTPRGYDAPPVPRDPRRWSHASDSPVKYLDEYMMEDYAHVGSLPLPRSHDARKKYYAAAYPAGNVNHAYSSSTLPARPVPRYY